MILLELETNKSFMNFNKSFMVFLWCLNFIFWEKPIFFQITGYFSYDRLFLGFNFDTI